VEWRTWLAAILCAVSTTNHAGAAAGAASARRTFAVEVGVRYGLAGFAEEHADGRASKRFFNAEFRGNL